MKKNVLKILALALASVLCLSIVSCGPTDDADGISDEVYEGDVIYVGNTAGTTGALATIGVPFNLGINAAFYEYNQNGGFNGKTVALKHYDDKGTATHCAAPCKRVRAGNVFSSCEFRLSRGIIKAMYPFLVLQNL